MVAQAVQLGLQAERGRQRYGAIARTFRVGQGDGLVWPMLGQSLIAIGPQSVQDFVRAAKAVERFLGQQAINQTHERFGRVGARVADLRRGGLHVLHGQRQRCFTTKRRLAGQHMKHRYTQRVEIAAHVNFAILQLLGAHIHRRTERRAGARQFRIVVQQTGQAKIGNLHIAVGGEQYVFRLDVAMDDADRRGLFERRQCLQQNTQRFSNAQRSTLIEVLTQIRSRNILWAI